MATAVLTLGLGSSTLLTYRGLARRAELIVRDRLAHAAPQIAELLGSEIAAETAALEAAARDPRVVRALAGGSGADVSAALRLIAAAAAPEDAAASSELRGGTGRLLAREGPEPSIDGPVSGVTLPPMYVAGGKARYWATVPVRAEGELVGYVRQSRPVPLPERLVAEADALMRERTRLFLRSADGAVWVAAGGKAIVAPRARMAAAGRRYEGSTGTVVAAEAQIAGTPWQLVVASPLAWIRQRPRRTLPLLALSNLTLVLVGGLLAWAWSRRLTRPLAALAADAEAVASGRYEQRVVATSRDEIGRLAASFDVMARDVSSARAELERRALEAEAANRAKSAFLGVMSHELRTPLNAIAGYTDLLQAELYGPVSEEQQAALERVQRNQAHLLTLIDEVLTFARLEAGRMRYVLESVPVGPVIEAVRETLEGEAVRADLRLESLDVPEDLAVRADRDKLRQVLLNLVGNALKYTPPGGTVTIGWSADEKMARIYVRDTGIGIPAARLESVFEPFEQGERSLDRPLSGVGLGLSISRDLVRGMGGQIEVDSDPERGSTFAIALPRAELTDTSRAALDAAVPLGQPA